MHELFSDVWFIYFIPKSVNIIQNRSTISFMQIKIWMSFWYIINNRNNFQFWVHFFRTTPRNSKCFYFHFFFLIFFFAIRFFRFTRVVFSFLNFKFNICLIVYGIFFIFLYLQIHHHLARYLTRCHYPTCFSYLT